MAEHQASRRDVSAGSNKARAGEKTMRTLATLAAVLAVTPRSGLRDANAAEAYTVDPFDRVMTVADAGKCACLAPAPTYDVQRCSRTKACTACA